MTEQNIRQWRLKMASTHLVFTLHSMGLRVAILKQDAILVENLNAPCTVINKHEWKTDTRGVEVQETFDELLKQLEETNGV